MATPGTSAPRGPQCEMAPERKEVWWGGDTARYDMLTNDVGWWIGTPCPNLAISLDHWPRVNWASAPPHKRPDPHFAALINKSNVIANLLPANLNIFSTSGTISFRWNHPRSADSPFPYHTATLFPMVLTFQLPTAMEHVSNPLYHLFSMRIEKWKITSHWPVWYIQYNISCEISRVLADSPSVK